MKQIVRVMVLATVSCLMIAFASPALAGLKGPVRAFHFVLRGVSLNDAKGMLTKAKQAGFNVILVALTDGVRLERAPWKPRSDAWTKAEFLAWISDARDQGLEVVPEVKLLTHQEKFLQNGSRDLMFNRSTYDPRKEGTYGRVFALLEEILTAMHPKVVHIGHDEVAGHDDGSKAKWLGPGEHMLPAELFLEDVSKIHEYLTKRGIETWMWGDMLIGRDEFPGMAPQHLHGNAPGYGKPLRDRLPRGIVICDWHYVDSQSDFPSLLAMQKEGFRVIGATWRKDRTIENFSRYAALHGGYGMIATTWAHVQRREWKDVEVIIRTSGAVFRREFPDE